MDRLKPSAKRPAEDMNAPSIRPAWMDEFADAQASKFAVQMRNELEPIKNNLTTLTSTVDKQQEQIGGIIQKQEDFQAQLNALKSERPASGSNHGFPVGNLTSTSRANPQAGSTAASDFGAGYDPREDPDRYGTGEWVNPVPTDAAIEQFENQVLRPNGCSLDDLCLLEANRPRTKYIFWKLKPSGFKTSGQRGWDIKQYLLKHRIIPLGAKETDKNRFGDPIRLYASGGRKKTETTGSEESQRKYMNTVCRFLHVTRETYNIPSTYQEFGKDVPVVWGTRSKKEGLCTTWKNIKVCTYATDEARGFHAAWDRDKLQQSLGKEASITDWDVEMFIQRAEDFVKSELSA